MGYYTHYTIDIVGTKDFEEKKKIIKEVNEVSGYGELFHHERNNGSFDTEESVKWYDWDDDVKEISAKYPELLFVILGDGEEDDDYWKCFFKAGKADMCSATVRIEYPDSKMEQEYYADLAIKNALEDSDEEV